VTDQPSTGQEDDPMTDAEFRVVREHLGLTGDWLAAHLKVTGRTVRAWEQGKYPIPAGVRQAIEDLESVTAANVNQAIDKLNDMRDPAIITYRTDEDFHARNPGVTYPASWHRAVVARCAQEVPGLVISYPPA
jgi:hypothetical protein